MNLGMWFFANSEKHEDNGYFLEPIIYVALCQFDSCIIGNLMCGAVQILALMPTVVRLVNPCLGTCWFGKTCRKYKW